MTIEELPRLDLHTVSGGEALELFEVELERVIENLLDVNADPDAKRKVTLTVEFKPGQDRGSVLTVVRAKSTLAPSRSAGGVAFVGRHRGKAIATVYDMRQTQLKWDEESKPTPIKSNPNVEAGATGTED